MSAAYHACGKFILLGEHFVVHGTPAIALPVSSVSTHVTVDTTASGAASTMYSDYSGEGPVSSAQYLARAMELLAIRPNVGWTVNVTSTIPVGMGMGSSASLAVALVGALAKAAARPITLEQLNTYAHQLECLIHGSPSGIDDTVITHGRPVQFRRNEPLQFIDAIGTFRFVLASSGGPGSTLDAVSSVRELSEQNPDQFSDWCNQARDIAVRGRGALQSGDTEALGALLNENHSLLQNIGVSTDMLDKLVDTAVRAGALGAKLTGAGLGGFALALVTEETQKDVVDALTDIGASPVLVTTLEPSQ